MGKKSHSFAPKWQYIGLGALTIATAGAVAFAFAEPGRQDAPVSPVVQSYYESPPPVPTPAPAEPLPEVEASVRMAGKSGPLTVMDTGQPIKNFGGAPGAVLDGTWQHNVGGFVAPAAYAQVELGGDVTRIGAAARFPTGDGKPGSIALVIPSASWEGNAGWKSGMHFVVNGNGDWNVSYFGDNKVGPTYASGNAGSFRDGKEVRFDVVVNRAAGTAMVVLPSGQRIISTNALITSDTSKFAIFEIYETGADSAPASITEMWTGSQ